MPVILKREIAKRDLAAQWLWYAQNASVEVADRFLRAADRTLRGLAAQPFSGAPFASRIGELAGVRHFPMSCAFDKLFLFYFAIENGIALPRLTHSSRYLESLLAERTDSRWGAL